MSNIVLGGCQVNSPLRSSRFRFWREVKNRIRGANISGNFTSPFGKLLATPPIFMYLWQIIFMQEINKLHKNINIILPCKIFHFITNKNISLAELFNLLFTRNLKALHTSLCMYRVFHGFWFFWNAYYSLNIRAIFIK